MPPALDESIKERVSGLWFSGETRENIAAKCRVGAGTVTNIINEWKKGTDSSEYEAIREMAVWSKKEGLTLSELASIYRRINYIKKLGANEVESESLIFNLLDNVKSTPPEKIGQLTDQLLEISKSESIAPIDVPVFVMQKMQEKKRLEEEIKKSGSDFAGQKCGYSNCRRIQEIRRGIEEAQALYTHPTYSCINSTHDSSNRI